jgi:hypothetical protein
MAANEIETSRESFCRLNNRTLGAPNIRHNGPTGDMLRENTQQFNVLSNRGRQEDDVRVSKNHRVVRSNVDRMQLHGMFKDALLVDSNDQR